MKNQFLGIISKFQSFKVSIIILGLFFSISFRGLGQFHPVQPYEYLVGPASNSTHVTNTGTDMIFIGDPRCQLQVSVWDGNSPGFGWRIGGHTGKKAFHSGKPLECESNFNLSDPDVVLAVGIHDEIIAKVVGIDPEGYVRTINYVFNPSTGDFNEPASCPCKYGAVWTEVSGPIMSGYTLGRKCTSPNIDANQAGETVITWTEIEEFYVEVTLGFPFPVPTTEFWKLKRGNVISAFGLISDNCLGCSGSRIVNQWDGNPIINPFNFSGHSSVSGFGVTSASILSNLEYVYPAGWFANSDVSISEKSENEADSTFISYVFYNYLYGGGGNPLHITQFKVDANRKFCPVWRKDWNSFSQYPGGRPRIASPTLERPGSPDFHVVLGYSGSYYDCETHTTSYSSNLGVIGVYNDVMINSGLSANIIDVSDITTSLNTDPCISYTVADIPEEQNTEFLVVSWTNRGGSSSFDQGEIVAKLYEVNDASEVVPEYSLVNEDLTGDQGVSSVAGRRAGGLVAYNWAEPSTGNIEMKQSDVPAGTDKLYGSNQCNEFPERPSGKKVEMLVFPNPTKKEFTILKNRDITLANYVDCELTDLMGRKVEVNVNHKTLEVVPTTIMPPGIYRLKITTTGKVFHTNIEMHP